MRKGLLLSTLALACLPILVSAQQPLRKAVASPAQLNARQNYRPKFEQMMTDYYDRHELLSRPVTPAPASPTIGKVSAVNPIGLGTASNALTCLRGEQNQVAVDNLTDAVLFIHRQDITVWGGAGTENGKYRYDLSIDNGSSFSNDIGTLQAVYTNYGRYPNAAFFNEIGTANPLQEKLVWQGPTNRFPTPGWVGQVNGLSDVVTSGTPATTEHYQFDGQPVLLPGGLCEGLPGEFWSVDFSFDGTNVMDSIRVYKGVYDGSSDMNWSLHTRIVPGYDKTFDGSIAAVGPNIAFSPDGMTGYIGIVANVLAGTNTNNETVLPVFWKTTDGGVTWGNAMEVDLDAFPWIADTLQTLWVDSSGAPASSGLATTGFDYDMIVDGNGNVHMGTIIGTAAGGFSIQSGIAKFLADVTTNDGGATWDVTYLSPILTFRGTYGGGSAPITIDNFVQVARDDAGDYVFFSWADSDTSQFTGSQNGIGFGESSNLAPNLRTVAKNLIDGTQTYPRLVTDGDLLWEGRALNPAMAPEVVIDNNIAHLPLVLLEFLQNDPNLPSKFWYFGNDATFNLSDPSIWCYQPQMQLGWTSFTTPGVTPVCAVGTEDPDGNADVTLFDWYPNPTTGIAKISFDLPGTMDIRAEVMNLHGQRVAVLAEGETRAGSHVLSLETANLAAGMYMFTLTADGKQYSKRLVVSK